MANIRFPILLWKDLDGHHFACAVHEPAESLAVGRTRSEVVEQVKEYFTFVHQREPWRRVPELEEAALTAFKIPVRPESRGPAEERKGRRKRRAQLFASPPVPLTIPCVHGKAGGGLMFAAAPLIQLFFTYAAGDRLKDSLIHYVGQALTGSSLERLTRLLAPTDLQLDEVIVRLENPRIESRESRVRTLESVADPISDRYFKTGLARPWSRDTLSKTVSDFLADEKASAILVGGAGVGKSALLVEAARRVQREDKSEGAAVGREGSEEEGGAAPRVPRFWQTSGVRIIAGMKYLGQWQERVEAIIAELALIKGVLCVERLLDLVSPGGRDPSASVGAFLLPYIRRGELRLVAEATPEELDACRRLLPGLVDSCRQFVVEPLTGPETVAALEQVGKVLAQGRRVTIEPAALGKICRLFSRFQPYHPMPGPAAAFLNNVLDAAARQKIDRVDAEVVLRQFTRRTGLPERLLRDELPLRREELLSEFERQIMGQPDACRAAADVILSFKAGVNDPRRPLGVLLFAGPTGVGKTELARAIAGYLFGQGEKKDRLVRLDMSEYGSGAAAERLLGPPGGEPGPLIREVRRQPFNVVLLDEIEKASPEVFDMLLGLFDEGRLTDRFGRLTTFRSAIVIMTSNLGATDSEPFGLSRTAAKSYESEVEAHFRPEFFNRIDAVVTFDRLTPVAMRQIATKELEALARREGFAVRKIRLEWTPAVLEKLVAVGFDPRYGARPLQRKLEELITTPLAKALARDRGRGRGVRAVTVDVQGGEQIVFRGLD